MAVNYNILAQPLPEPTPFNPLAAIQAHRQGVADFRTDRKDNALMSAGQRMAAGDSKGAQSALYGAGEFDAGFKIQEHQFKQAQHELDVLTRAGRAADLADTPEKWAQVHRTLGLPAQYSDFRSGRETARMLAYDKAALLQQELQRSQMALNRSHASLFDAQAAAAGAKENPYQVEAQKQRAKDDEEWRTQKLSSIEASDDMARQAQAVQQLLKDSKGKGVGPVSGSIVGRAWDMTPLGDKDRAALRATIDSRLSEIELTLAKAYLKGQGSVTDQERQIILRMIATAREQPETVETVMGDISSRMQEISRRARTRTSEGRAAPLSAPASPAGPASPPQKATDAPAVTHPRITNDSEYDTLPAGTVFVGPDGKLRKKP